MDIRGPQRGIIILIVNFSKKRDLNFLIEKTLIKGCIFWKICTETFEETRQMFALIRQAKHRRILKNKQNLLKSRSKILEKSTEKNNNLGLKNAHQGEKKVSFKISSYFT